MNIGNYLKNGKYILSDNPKLQYSGRIGCGRNGMPEMVFPCSFVKWRFKGKDAAVIVDSQRSYFDVYAGCFIDGVQYTIKLDEGVSRIELLEGGLPKCSPEMYRTQLVGVEDPGGQVAKEDGLHEIMFFKRQDACNIIEICGIELDKDAELLECEPLPELKIEVYGDSVSAGEVSEALDRTGKPDPEGHEGKYSNSWYSYSWIAARKLNAQLHDIAQGGIPLLDGTGWFGAQEDLIGMESIYDKIRYYPDRRNAEKWDFSKYIPDVAVLAFGQNDSHPDDFMKTLREGRSEGTGSDDRNALEKAENWKTHYRAFIEKLRSLYPDVFVICTTTILMHDPAWDDAIDEVVNGINDPKVRHFLYSKNGSGTPGHIRANEAEEMAEELAAFIRENI